MKLGFAEMIEEFRQAPLLTTGMYSIFALTAAVLTVASGKLAASVGRVLEDNPSYISAQTTSPLVRKVNQEQAARKYNELFRTDLSYQELTNKLSSMNVSAFYLMNLLK